MTRSLRSRRLRTAPLLWRTLSRGNFGDQTFSTFLQIRPLHRPILFWPAPSACLDEEFCLMRVAACRQLDGAVFVKSQERTLQCHRGNQAMARWSKGQKWSEACALTGALRSSYRIIWSWQLLCAGVWRKFKDRWKESGAEVLFDWDACSWWKLSDPFLPTWINKRQNVFPLNDKHQRWIICVSSLLPSALSSLSCINFTQIPQRPPLKICNLRHFWAAKKNWEKEKALIMSVS